MYAAGSEEELKVRKTSSRVNSSILSHCPVYTNMKNWNKSNSTWNSDPKQLPSGQDLIPSLLQEFQEQRKQRERRGEQEVMAGRHPCLRLHFPSVSEAIPGRAQGVQCERPHESVLWLLFTSTMDQIKSSLEGKLWGARAFNEVSTLNEYTTWNVGDGPMVDYERASHFLEGNVGQGDWQVHAVAPDETGISSLGKQLREAGL